LALGFATVPQGAGQFSSFKVSVGLLQFVLSSVQGGRLFGLTGDFEMKQLYLATAKFLRDEEGVTIIEYALIAALVAVASAVIIGKLGAELNTIFTTICTKVNNNTACP
jgi:pilus assembly protein Flp/PilA